MRHPLLKAALLAGAASAAIGLWTPATAQTSATTDLDTVIVTARRVEENIQSVPVSVSALSAEKLRSQNVVDLFDLQRASPGLTVSATARGTTQPAYQIRGQRASNTSIQTDPAIVVYFAEVGASRSVGSAQSVFDVASVQVLKGPQGTLFGRNTTGGAILVTPNAPTSEFGGYVRGAVGNFDLSDLESVLNVPLGDKAALRVAGRVYRRDGFMTNVLTGGKSWDEDNRSLRVSLLLQPTEAISSTFIATYFDSDVTGFQPKLTFVNPAGTPAAFLAGLQSEAALNNALGFYDYREFFTALNKDKVTGIQNTTTIDLGEDIGALGSVRLKNIVGYREIKNRFGSFADGSALGVIQTFGSYNGSQFSDELQLQGKSGPLEYVAGAFYSVEKGTDFSNGQNFRVLPISNNEYIGRNRSMSVFGHVNVDLASVAEGLSLSGGARYTRDKRRVDASNRQARATAPLFGCTASGVLQPIASLDDRAHCSFVTTASFSEPTWDVSLNYQIDPEHLVYVAHRHGYRSGAAASATTPALRPETVNDVEFGSKNEFSLGGMSSRLNLAAYYGKYKDLQRQVTVIINGVGAVGVQNAGASKVYGLESEFNIRLSDSLSLNASYAWTKAKYDRYVNFVGTVPIDDSSSIFAYTPEHMINIGGRFVAPLNPDDGELSLAATYSYQTKFQTTDSNSYNCGPGGIEKWCLNTVGLLPGYGLLSLRADWRKPLGAPFDMAIFVNNALDKKYLAGAFPLVSVLGFQSVWAGPPRMVGFELKVPFGG